MEIKRFQKSIPLYTGKKLKIGVTLVVPAKDEEPRIEQFLLKFKPYVDAILVIEDSSKDRTVEIAKKYADKVISLDPSKLPQPTHQVQVYNEALRHIETEWCLYADCDELWDEGFLTHIKEFMDKHKEALCLIFPRINLPDAKNYPDYQVRMVKTAWTIWKCEPHIIPYLNAKTETEEIIDVPLDQVVETHKQMDDYPIIHLPRRADIKRKWWNET